MAGTPHFYSSQIKSANMLLFVVCFVPVLMNDGVKEPPVPPRGGEVGTSYTHVAICYLLGPEQQPLLGCHVLGLPCHMDLRDLSQKGKRRF